MDKDSVFIVIIIGVPGNMRAPVDDQDFFSGTGCQPFRQHAAGETGTHNQIIERLHSTRSISVSAVSVSCFFFELQIYRNAGNCRFRLFEDRFLALAVIFLGSDAGLDESHHSLPGIVPRILRKLLIYLIQPGSSLFLLLLEDIFHCLYEFPGCACD